MGKWLIKHQTTLLFLLISIGAVLRFTNLYWGDPFWFHPDERNIASAVTRLSWPDQMDPEFFAYGTVPIYLNFFIVKLVQYFGSTEDPFSTAIKAGRLISALLSTTLIPLMYWITKRYFVSGRRNIACHAPAIAAALTTFTVGFIQFAHFGTFEIWLTVEYLLLLIVAVELAFQRKPPPAKGGLGGVTLVILTGIIFGIAVGTKITSLVLLPGIFLGLFIGKLRAKKVNLFSKVIQLLSSSIMLLITAFFVFSLTNPYAFNPELPPVINIQKLSDLNVFLNPSFTHSINVEGGIARGDIQVFYTRHFTDTIPGLYQLVHVYPYALSWPVLILGIIGIIWMAAYFLPFIRGGQEGSPLKKNNLLTTNYLLLTTFFLLQIAFIFSLHVKWARYTIPTLPYLVIAAACVIPPLMKGRSGGVTIKNKNSLLVCLIIGLFVIWHLLQSLAFMPVYTQPDPRIAAAQWASANLSPDSQILSEVYDLGITPMNRQFMRQIDLYNFYDLDNPGSTKQQNNITIEQYNTIIILSRRIWKHSLDHPDQFPQAANFYQQLFSGQLGYAKTIEFSNPPSPLFNFLTFSFSDEISAEETFSVFDHPTVQIWQKE